MTESFLLIVRIVRVITDPDPTPLFQGMTETEYRRILGVSSI